MRFLAHNVRIAERCLELSEHGRARRGGISACHQRSKGTRKCLAVGTLILLLLR